MALGLTLPTHLQSPGTLDQKARGREAEPQREATENNCEGVMSASEQERQQVRQEGQSRLSSAGLLLCQAKASPDMRGHQ